MSTEIEFTNGDWKYAKTPQDQLEDLVDQHGLEDVVGMLGTICHEKAEHLETNWQDKRTAAAWTTAGRRLETTSRVNAIRLVSPSHPKTRRES